MKIDCVCLLPVLMQLIGGLSDEKVRWHESVLAMDGQIVNIVGDVMISSGVIAYLGTFTVSIRYKINSGAPAARRAAKRSPILI